MKQQDWKPWHPVDLMQALTGIGLPWCVVGGWALDLWHGVQTRPHEDIEFTVLPPHLPAFRQKLGHLSIHAVNDGTITPLPPQDRPAPHIEQFWCLDPAEKCWRVDMMLEHGTPHIWVCKRHPAITYPRAQMVHLSAEGVPYLGPEAVLLMKAKYVRPKDEHDFAMALPKLRTAERERLKTWLALVHPGHVWAAAL